MWSKGAVVIVKRGDEPMANAIEDGVIRSLVPSSEMEEIMRENFFLKRQNNRNNMEKIRNANFHYRRRILPFGIPKLFIDIYAITVYGISEFVSRYMTIRKE